MIARLANLVSRHWLLVILAWVALVIVLRPPLPLANILGRMGLNYRGAPAWNEITHDGDLAYLPDEVPSVRGERLMEAAFPHDRAKSQIVLVVARDDVRLDGNDISVGIDLARRFSNFLGVASLTRARELARNAARARAAGDLAAADTLQQRGQHALTIAEGAFNEGIALDERLAAHWAKRRADGTATFRPSRLAALYHNRAIFYEQTDRADEAARDRAIAAGIDPPPAAQRGELVPAAATRLPLLDVWTWHHDVFGEKLTSDDGKARLIVLQFSNEFMATDNIRVLEQVEAELDEVRQTLDQAARPGLSLGLSGSAGVGGDMLRSAAESIKNTELCTVLLVLLILVLIYRSPILVAVPVISITISLIVATSTVALLTQLGTLPGFQWWQLKVFTTTKIFVVVILFGAGTDYCLFLISRYREELAAGLPPEKAISTALAQVGDALAASALTTIFGLAMMFFADFGKFRYSGPVIGFCLAVTLATCMTLTPALLRGLGAIVFWPFGLVPLEPEPAGRDRTGSGIPAVSRIGRRFWERIAGWIIATPGRILIGCIALMVPLAGYGWMHEHDVTYDFLSALGAGRPSRQGADLLRRHFPVGESGPLTVLARVPGARFNEADGRYKIRELAGVLRVPGVETVRSIEDPLGQYLPDEYPSLISSGGVRLRFLRAHHSTKAIFVTPVPELAGEVTRLEVVLRHDPFSIEAAEVLREIDRRLQTLAAGADAYWKGATFAYGGTTAALRDLRAVTQSDQLRIKLLVVVAVLLVLLLILRRPLICIYMIGSVLLSYYVTVGTAELFFAAVYGDAYQGLDWKVPLFLFVILVAIGQDYNVYLATRVFEEQSCHGPVSGLRRAVISTGGIITSCGIIMAGTFVSMTSGTWGALVPSWVPLLPGLLADSGGALRGIVELGFALTLGVLLDTFVVRPILLPAFIALLIRWRAAGRIRPPYRSAPTPDIEQAVSDR